MNIKCIGCYELRREEILYGGETRVIYNCPGHFPCAFFIRGLLRPAEGIRQAAEACPERIDLHCILCTKPPIKAYGEQIVFVCKEHDAAWGKWLDEHPGKREHIAPKGRARKENWIEVFREFIEDMRLQAEGNP